MQWFTFQAYLLNSFYKFPESLKTIKTEIFSEKDILGKG